MSSGKSARKDFHWKLASSEGKILLENLRHSYFHRLNLILQDCRPIIQMDRAKIFTIKHAFGLSLISGFNDI